MQELLQIQEQNFSFLGEGSSLRGEFELEGTTHLASAVEGTLKMLGEDMTLTIEPKGSIKGKIICHDIEIYGHIEGEIQSTGVVTFFPSADFKGKIEALRIVIHPGAVINMEGKTLS
jgi:cytoskeletal protein CcmA (bactofilin family)